MKMTMSEKHRARAEADIMEAVRAYLDEIDRCQPTWDDGFTHSIKIEGAVVAWDEQDEDRPLYSFRVTREQEGDL